jgi:hypothetical protein
MPGPVSDSYDPEFGTGANAADVADAIKEVKGILDKKLGPKLQNIVAIAQSKNGTPTQMRLTERQLRIIRFCLNRSIESI